MRTAWNLCPRLHVKLEIVMEISVRRTIVVNLSSFTQTSILVKKPWYLRQNKHIFYATEGYKLYGLMETLKKNPGTIISK